MLKSKLVLFHFILRQFGFAQFKELREKLNDREVRFDVFPNSEFYSMLLSKIQFSDTRLRQYDDNILQFLSQINAHRKTKINLKYFQYFSLLFTEYYLDRYFEDLETLLDDLNLFLVEFNQNLPTKEQIPEFEKEDLNLLAFWNATGSGKTFLLHLNILQYKYYCKSINNIILLTPSESLSKQHRIELEQSGIECETYINSRSGSSGVVKLIEITKIKEVASTAGVTVSIDEFGEGNAVFVDEGHKGSSSEESKWRELRKKLGYRGFTFEYSATFGQIPKNFFLEYGKSIVFDYSYSYFYDDGYGKAFWIYNVKDPKQLDSDEIKRRYFFYNLLLFTQQKIYFAEYSKSLEEYNLENPLMLFVGNTVAGKKANAELPDENTLSDVQMIVHFLSDIVSKAKDYKKFCKELIKNKEVFATDYFHKLNFLFEYCENNPDMLYASLIKHVFNSEAPDKLELRTISSSSGEIGLKLKNCDHYFGLINIGDLSSFKTSFQAEYKIDLEFSSDKISHSLFDSISIPKDNPVNLLIGSRKFIEGWNSFRVSSIGLINFGVKEGTQIIQLFGRGVRLKGKDFSLKRNTDKAIRNIDLIETLNIFGLRADFMQVFEDTLRKEGLDTNREEILIPVRFYPDFTNPNADKIKELNLFILRRMADNGGNPTNLELKHESNIRVNLDFTSKFTSYDSAKNKKEGTLTIIKEELKKHSEFLDLDSIYETLRYHKTIKNYKNLVIKREAISSILKESTIEISLDYELTHDRLGMQKLNKIASLALRSYTDIFYNRHMQVIEAKKMDIEVLTHSSSLLQDLDYTVSVKTTNEDGTKNEQVTAIIRKIEKLLKDKDYPKRLDGVDGIKNAWFDRHLFQPLLAESDNLLFNIPKALNSGETNFVEDILLALKNKEKEYSSRELTFYLLRNSNRNKGIGFYFSTTGGFYPDFIFWIKAKDTQYITFIDPHGLRMEGNAFDSDKIRLKDQIKEIEKTIANNPKGKVVLNSFILSPSKLNTLTNLQHDFERIKKLENISVSYEEYANANHIYEIPESNSEYSYIHKIIEAILADK